jgi:ABC-2 type transport system permease protein
VGPQGQHALNSGVTWFGWRVPTLLEAAVIVILGLAMLGIAIWEFSATD